MKKSSSRKSLVRSPAYSPVRPATAVTYQDEGKGLVTRTCWECNGTGRVYEGGYGLRDCELRGPKYFA